MNKANIVSHDEVDTFRGLIPTLISSEPSINPIDPSALKTGGEILEFAQRKGSNVTHSPLSIFRSTSLGKFRQLDNEDLITGYSPIFPSVSALKHLISDLKGFIPKIYDVMDKDVLWTTMEDEDLKKITIQRVKHYGYFLQPPFAEDIRRHDDYSSDFLNMLERVLHLVAENAGPLLRRLSWEDAVIEVTDRTESNVGLPSMMSGEGTTSRARLLTMLALPTPAKGPDQYFSELNRLGTDVFGLQDGMIVSPCISTRFGPSAKPVKLWKGEPSYFEADYEAIGYYPRVRLVYGVPYHVNFALAKLYVQLKAGVYKLLGCNPELMAFHHMVKEMAKQGKKVYTFDFSGMDQHYHNHLVAYMANLMGKMGFDSFGSRFLELCMLNGGIVFPGFEIKNGITYFSSFYGWVSGSQLTAIINTIYNIAVNLTVINEQNPRFVHEYFNRRKFIAALGDDGQFTDSYEYDMEKYTKSAFDHAGAVLKLKNDTIFLKKILPTGYGVSAITKPISRIIQQTFFNEDSYVDREAWPEIMILGLLARCDTIQNHKYYNVLWPQLSKLILDHCRYTDSMPAEQRANFVKGRFELTNAQRQRIVEFGNQSSNWMSILISRSEFQPSAKEFLQLLLKAGVSIEDTVAENSKMRKTYLRAWYTKPSNSNIDDLVKITRWIQ